MLRIGLLTSGGDCQALNATMRGVVKGLANNVKDLEVYGFMNGYKGLIYSDYRMLSAKDFSGRDSHLYCKVSETRGGAFGSDGCV